MGLPDWILPPVSHTVRRCVGRRSGNGGAIPVTGSRPGPALLQKKIAV